MKTLFVVAAIFSGLSLAACGSHKSNESTVKWSWDDGRLIPTYGNYYSNSTSEIYHAGGARRSDDGSVDIVLTSPGTGAFFHTFNCDSANFCQEMDGGGLTVTLLSATRFEFNGNIFYTTPRTGG